MLKCLNLLEDWDQGDILLEGQPLGFDTLPDGRRKAWNGSKQAKLRMKIGMIFQHFNLFPHMTALQNVMVSPRSIRGWSSKDATRIAERLLDQVGLASKIGAYPAHLSGGQQQRVAIARALAMEPEVLLLDEITSALDPESVDEVLNVISDLKKLGMTMVFVTHEIQFAHDVADKILFFENGQICESGTADAVLTTPKSESLRRFLSRYTSARGASTPN